MRAELDALTDRQLRDIGIEHSGAAAGYVLTDLLPGDSFFGPRRQRWR